MDAPPESSRVSVDAVGLRYNTHTGNPEILIHRRAQPPYVGKWALPGVLQSAGERVTGAAGRALAKAGVHASAIRSCGMLIVFDEPNRDPRGPTLSIAAWAVIDPDTAIDKDAQWVAFGSVPKLAFDHNRIVEDCRPKLASRLWTNSAFTRALTGSSFPVSTALNLATAFNGTAPDRGNLNRMLSNNPKLTSQPRSARDTGGRPGTIWTWT